MDPWLIIKTLWPLVGGVVGAAAWLRFFHKKERRLFKNIKRPICVIGTTDKSMTHEAKLLKRVGFFNVEEATADGRETDLLNGSRLAIIGYTPGSEKFKKAFNVAKHKEIPVVVYAGPTRINNEDMELLQNYSHQSMCNTPLRLISDVFALMSTYPEGR